MEAVGDAALRHRRRDPALVGFEALHRGQSATAGEGAEDAGWRSLAWRGGSHDAARPARHGDLRRRYRSLAPRLECLWARRNALSLERRGPGDTGRALARLVDIAGDGTRP